MSRWLLRSILWLLTHSIYRLRKQGVDNIPATGPALLVSNHVTYLDWLFIVAAQPRHVHFVIFAGWTRTPVLGRLLGWAGVVPIDHTGGPRAIIKSLRAAGDLLKQGKLVCIFAEGRFTRTGFLLPFKRGFEQILKHGPAPIVPVYLDSAWGSILSYYGGKLIWKRPRRLPYTIGVAFGEPLPASASPFEVRQALQKLSADAMLARRDELTPPVCQFQRRARRHPFRPCLLAVDASQRTLSYAGAFIDARRLAQRLRGELRDNGPIVICAPNGAGAALANIACAMLGRAVVNIDPADSPDRQAAIWKESRAKECLFDRKRPDWFDGTGSGAIEAIDVREKLFAQSAADRLRGVLALLFRSIRVEPNDLAAVVFRDDPEGNGARRPAGVMLTHANLAANCESLRQTIGPDAADRCLGVLPLADSFGLTVTLWLPLSAGASVALCNPAAASSEIGAVCRQTRCTVIPATASRLAKFAAGWKAQDAASLRLVICAGEPLDTDLAQRLRNTWNVEPLECYGRHELSPAAIVSVPNRAIDGFTQQGVKPGAAGQPLPGVAVKIVDPVTRNSLAPGQTGMLLAYGANVSPGYWGRPELTAKSFVDGWFATGDEAMMDDDGFVTITPTVV